MKVKYDQAAGDRALEAIVKIADYFCGPEEPQIQDADRLQCALRRLKDFIAYVDTVVDNNYEQYHERLLAAIESVVEALEADFHDGE